MHRRGLALLRPALVIALPLVAACPNDAAPIEETGDSSVTPTSDGESTTADPDTTTDASTETTSVDPDTTTTTDAESSSSDDTSTGVAGCGDGFVDLGAGETCDGSNLDGRDCLTEDFAGGVLACNADCTLDTSGCTYQCGDGEVQGDEQCEGNDLDGNDCLSQGFEGGDLGCNADCTFDVSACENYDCGDGLAAGPEVCDSEDLVGEDCGSLGFDSGTLACLADCTDFDTSNCFVCGDGVINGGEVCDGAALDGATCINQGLDGGVISCADDCTLDLSECTGCGNGDADPGEQCDGGDLGGFTCAALGFDAGSPSCNADCTISDLSCAGLHTFCASPSAALGPGAGALTLSSIPVAGLAGGILDVDVFVDADHTRVSDLDIDVRHVGSNISVSLADDQCTTNNDILATFDQDAAGPPDCVEPNAIEGNVVPLGNLDAYVDVEAVGPGNGTWELSITDQVAGEGGALNQWCVAITTGSLAGSLLTVRTDDNVLVALDPVTLVMTDIGNLNVDFDFGEIAWDDATDTMYMVDGWAQNSLYTVDITTGNATLVGFVGEDLFGLEVDPTTGLLYGSRYSPGALYTLDPANGSPTSIGDIGYNGDGLAWDSLRNEMIGIQAGAGELYRVDLATGAGAVLSMNGFINNCGLAYEPIGDLFWAIDWSGDVFTYDPNNNYLRTSVMSVGNAHDGMAFVPGYVP
jgi:hypothetical protein